MVDTANTMSDAEFAAYNLGLVQGLFSGRLELCDVLMRTLEKDDMTLEEFKSQLAAYRNIVVEMGVGAGAEVK